MANRPKPANIDFNTHTPVVGNKPSAPTPVGNTHVLQITGDFGVWDVTADKAVLVDQTTINKNQ